MTKNAPKQSNLGDGGESGRSISRFFLSHVFLFLRRYFGQIAWISFLVYLIHTLGVVLLAYVGQKAFPEFLMNVKADVSFNASLGINVALTGGIVFREMSHRKVRERLTTRIRNLELQIDARRTSSNLMADGRTREGDL